MGCKMKFFKKKEKKKAEKLNLGLELVWWFRPLFLAWEPQKRGQPGLHSSREARGYIATPYFKTQDKMKQNKNSRRAGLNVEKKVIER